MYFNTEGSLGTEMAYGSGIFSVRRVIAVFMPYLFQLDPSTFLQF